MEWRVLSKFENYNSEAEMIFPKNIDATLLRIKFLRYLFTPPHLTPSPYPTSPKAINAIPTPTSVLQKSLPY